MPSRAVMRRCLLLLVVLSLLMSASASVYSVSEFGGRKMMMSRHKWREMEQMVASVDYSLDRGRRNFSPPAPKPNTHNPLPLSKKNR